MLWFCDSEVFDKYRLDSLKEKKKSPVTWGEK